MTKNKTNSVILKVCAIAVLIVAAFAVAHISDFWGLFMSTVCIYIVATTGLDLLFGYSGQISFGHVAFYCIGAYTSALLCVKLGFPPLLGMVCAILLAGLIGAFISIPAVRLQRHFLSFLTIAFAQVMQNFVSVTDPLTGGQTGLLGIPEIKIFGITLSRTNRVSFFYFAFAVVVLVLIIKQFIVNSRTGRAFRAIKANITAANGIGINIYKYKIMAFVVSGAFTGLAGAMFAHQVGYISPDNFSQTVSTLFMMILLTGGLGTFAGPIIGSILLMFVDMWVQGFASYQRLVYAIFIIVTLYFMPNGVVGIAEIVKQRFGKICARRQKANAEVK
jgi:branched-chain amino acid transport system permease protein